MLLLPVYEVPEEREDYGLYLAGEPLPDRAQHRWMTLMRLQVRAGRTWTNVHLLSQPLTPYLQYLSDWWYRYQHQAGARILFLAPEHASTIRALASRDFWLFDDERVVVLEYDLKGKFQSAEDATSPESLAAVRRARDFAVQNAMSLRTLLSARRKERSSS